mmetsp:Transcript_3575/g.7383  ORF Transcript_3575/g.7383 Transcript_3575/m.7383 type:complete len:198 (-) Transcript_3575:997-1590(-)
MGISRDSNHKRRLTGGKKKSWRKKRKHELGRQASNTKIGLKHISHIRVRGGNYKKRALKLDYGNFSWVSRGLTRKTRILAVVYNASNNELARTNTLVKGSIVYIDVSPFKIPDQKWDKFFPQKKNEKNVNKESLIKKKNEESYQIKTNEFITKQIETGKFLARICSRPGQSGRADGYILEKAELEFYSKKFQKKKKF